MSSYHLGRKHWQVTTTAGNICACYLTKAAALRYAQMCVDRGYNEVSVVEAGTGFCPVHRCEH
jgi:hypothetical protein